MVLYCVPLRPLIETNLQNNEAPSDQLETWADNEPRKVYLSLLGKKRAREELVL